MLQYALSFIQNNAIVKQCLVQKFRDIIDLLLYDFSFILSMIKVPFRKSEFSVRHSFTALAYSQTAS